MIEDYKSGKLYKHARYGKKNPPEFAIANKIASQGKVVKLLPRSDYLKSPDLWVDGQIWEVKRISGSQSSIDNALRSKQSEQIILEISSEIDQAIITELLKRRAHIRTIWVFTPQYNEIIQNKSP